MISSLENYPDKHAEAFKSLQTSDIKVPVLGITGTGGAGKSSMVDELVRRFLLDFTDKKIAIVSVDPSKRKTGGALLGDRIRINSASDQRVFIRSFATRGSGREISQGTKAAIDLLRSQDFDFLIFEISPHPFSFINFCVYPYDSPC